LKGKWLDILMAKASEQLKKLSNLDLYSLDEQVW
jgi:hypothetical protein